MKAVLTFTISDVTPNIDITNHDHGADVSIQTQELYFNVNNSVKTDTAVIDFGSLYVKGDKGDTGPLGELGIQGIQGPKGDKGDKGDTGARGLTGPEGPVGPAGERGPIGPQGLQGPQGPVGERGPKGDKGDRGERGLQGLQGVQGERGEKGERGEQGAVGPVGPKGDRGEVGPVGPQGILGERGPQGERGELGIQGPIGPQGPAGDNVVIIETSVTETDGVTYVCSVEKSSTEIQQLIAQGKVCYWHVAEMNVYVLIDASWYTITGSSVDMDGQYYYIYIYRQQGNTLYGRVFQSVTLDDIPTIPTNVSEFTNDAGYLTEHLSLSNYLTKDLASLTYQSKGNYALSSNIPTKVSLLTNDSGYLTQHQSLSGYIPFGKALLTKNSFASQKDLYISKIDNSLYAANSRYIVTHQAFDEDGNKIANLNTGLFDCDYEHAQTLSASLQPSYAEVYIGVVAEDNLETTTSQFRTYGSGYLFLSFYNIWYPSPEDVEVWGYVKEHSSSGQTRGWKKLGNAETYGNKSVLRISTNAIATYPVAIKIKYACKRHSGNYVTSLCQVEWFGTRCSANFEAGITKYPYAQTMYGNLTAPKFIVNGGKSTQFMKADGSLDSTIYQPKGDYALKSEIPTVPTKTSQLVNDSNYLITPSGDPMHYMYIKGGAEYNGTNSDVTKVAPWGEDVVHKSGYWYLNGIGDITTEEMREIYCITHMFGITSHQLGVGRNSTIRTNLAYETQRKFGSESSFSISGLFQDNRNIKVINFGQGAYFASHQYGVCLNCTNLEYVLGQVTYSTGAQTYVNFLNCTKLKMLHIKTGGSFSFATLKSLQTESVAYAINNVSNTNAITFTLHPDVYAKAMEDADVLSALQAHSNVTLVSG